MDRLTPDEVSPNRSAARVKLPVSATATSVPIPLKSLASKFMDDFLSALQ
jgi:hypothetical protein